MEGDMIPELSVRVGHDLVLQVGADDTVTVPMDKQERALCRKALEDALLLLSQTTVTRSTFATEAGSDEVSIQTSPHLSDCHATVCYSRP